MFFSKCAQKFHETIDLRFYPTLLKLCRNIPQALYICPFLLKLCPKVPHNYSLAFLSNFAQIVPKNSTRLQTCVFIQLCSNCAQTFHKPCIFVNFCSNLAQKFHKTIAWRFYQTLLNCAQKISKTIALRFYPTLLKFCPNIPQDYRIAFLFNFAQIVPNNSP